MDAPSASASTSISTTAIATGTTLEKIGLARRLLESVIAEAKKLFEKEFGEVDELKEIVVGLTGMAKAGKSTFGNVLLERLVFPMGLGDSPSHPVVVVGTHEEEEKYFLVRRDGKREDGRKGNKWSKGCPLPSSAVVGIDDRIDFVEAIVHGCPLLECGVKLIEFSMDQEQSPVTGQLVSKAALVFFIVDASVRELPRFNLGLIRKLCPVSSLSLSNQFRQLHSIKPDCQDRSGREQDRLPRGKREDCPVFSL